MNDLEKIVIKLKEADAFLIGASNGFSITEGIHLFANNEAFKELFGDYQAKYGLPNLLSGMGGQWPNEEEMWAFWSRMVNHYCNRYEPSESMKNLRSIVGDKDYFIVTSNGEQHFEKAGFDDEKVMEVEGDWLHMQCANGCHDIRYNWAHLAKQMAESQINGKVPTKLIPKCPKCGGSMIPNMAAGHSFFPKPGVAEQYQKFLDTYHGKNLVILELGIGWRNQLIKAPLMMLTAEEPNTTYITINLGEIYIPDQIREKSYGLDGYLDEMLSKLRNYLSDGKGEHIMRIAVTYDNEAIFQHFGRTEQFKVYDVEDNKIINEEVVDTNGQGHGALANFLFRGNVDALICGGIGGGAQAALADAGIKLYGGVSGNADEAVTAFLAGKLDYNKNVNCSHHEHKKGHTCGVHSCGEDKHGCAGNSPLEI